MAKIHPAVWLVAGAFAGYAVTRATQERTVKIQCRDEEIDAQTVANVLLGACRACDRLTPVLEPISIGETPSLNLILSTLRSPVGR